jgi:hypothetical protein
MDSLLPPTGTIKLLTELSPHVPDDFINDRLPPHRGQGRRGQFTAAQLWRVHLLSVLTPVHAFNLLVPMLGEQRAWREFAHLPNRHAGPDVWMLHQFRHRAGVNGLRKINEHLLQPLLPRRDAQRMSVAWIDATDLEAACSGPKKKRTGKWSARRAASGARTLKTGQSRFFLGYKQHTFRLWLSEYWKVMPVMFIWRQTSAALHRSVHTASTAWALSIALKL